MAKKKRWLEPNLLSDEDKAMVARVAHEQHMTVEDVLSQLAAEQERQTNPQPPPARRSLLKTSGRHAEPPSPSAVKRDPLWPTDKSRPLDPEPASTTLGYEVEDTRHLENPETQNEPPDPRLVEIARLWPRLNERDREEMLLTARMKVHLNNKAPK